LQIIDLEIDQRGRRLEEVKGILAKNEELERARQTLQEDQQRLQQQQAKLRDRELEMQSLSNKIASVNDRLYSGHIKNPKELASRQDELQYLQRRKSGLEDQLLEAMIEVEESEAHVNEQQERVTRLEEEWQETQVRLSAERSELVNRLEQLKAKRTKLQQTVEAGDLALYEDLRRRKHGQAVALLEGDLCQTCRVTLPSRKAQQARQGEGLTLCGNCDRILHAEG
jgi:hypothetical protein